MCDVWRKERVTRLNAIAMWLIMCDTKILACDTKSRGKGCRTLLSATCGYPSTSLFFIIGSQVKLTPSFLKILLSTSPSITVLCT